jgi:hypothetical protein
LLGRSLENRSKDIFGVEAHADILGASFCNPGNTSFGTNRSQQGDQIVEVDELRPR